MSFGALGGQRCWSGRRNQNIHLQIRKFSCECIKPFVHFTGKPVLKNNLLAFDVATFTKAPTKRSQECGLSSLHRTISVSIWTGS
jgi:hypothetical protein